MQQVELKLKQASAVLGATPKDVQNLVQFRLVRPRRRNGVYWFDANALLTANVVLYLKESLGASTASLLRVSQAVARVPGFTAGTAETLSITFRRSTGQRSLEIRIPLRLLAEDLEKRLPLANAAKDLPRGRKRQGWKTEFRTALQETATALGNVSEADVMKAIRGYREGKPELQVVAETKRVAI